MIKFTASGQGRTIVGLGLEPGNIARMIAKQPIRVRLADLGFQGATGAIDIVIFTGSYEEMKAAIERWIGPDTVVHNTRDRNDPEP